MEPLHTLLRLRLVHEGKGKQLVGKLCLPLHRERCVTEAAMASTRSLWRAGGATPSLSVTKSSLLLSSMSGRLLK